MQMATWNGTDVGGSNSLENAPPKRADGGARGPQRSSRRANGGILKSIRRKLPWNRRGPRDEGNLDFSEDSDSALSTGKSGGGKPKFKPRAVVCPVPSPLRRFGGADQDGLYVRRRSDAEAPLPARQQLRGSASAPASPPAVSGPKGEDYQDYAAVAVPQAATEGDGGESRDAAIELYGLPARSLTAELYRLTRFGWYWGPITRFEAEEKLQEQPDGAFLVRDSSDDRYLLSLSFRSFGKTLHTRIEHCNGVFSFYLNPSSEGFDSPVDLIEHSMSYSRSGIFCYSRARTPGAPSLPVRLTKPVSRFTHVRSLQYLCRCIIRQHTRVDHIQRLPLPSRIIDYIQARLY